MQITNRIKSAIVKTEGLSESEANSLFWLVDRNGLLVQSMSKDLRQGQEHYARPDEEVKDWQQADPDQTGFRLLDVIREVRPTILVRSQQIIVILN